MVLIRRGWCLYGLTTGACHATRIIELQFPIHRGVNRGIPYSGTSQLAVTFSVAISIGRIELLLVYLGLCRTVQISSWLFSESGAASVVAVSAPAWGIVLCLFLWWCFGRWTLWCRERVHVASGACWFITVCVSWRWQVPSFSDFVTCAQCLWISTLAEVNCTFWFSLVCLNCAHRIGLFTLACSFGDWRLLTRHAVSLREPASCSELRISRVCAVQAWGVSFFANFVCEFTASRTSDDDRASPLVVSIFWNLNLQVHFGRCV